MTNQASSGLTRKLKELHERKFFNVIADSGSARDTRTKRERLVLFVHQRANDDALS